MQMIRTILRMALSSIYVVIGGAYYSLKGITPHRTFIAMINLHCSTNGLSSKFVHQILRWIRPSKNIKSNPHANELLGALTKEQQDEMLAELKNDGFCIASVKLSDDICSHIMDFAKTTPAEPWDSAGRIYEKAIYDKNRSGIGKFQFDKNDIVKISDIQNLLADSSIISFAQNFLGCFPVIDSVNLWWSLPNDGKASEEIAQTFHFDCDRAKWLKMFVYLTDVDKNTGPHVFVKNSQKSEARRASLLKRGYVRVSDVDMAEVYDPDEIVELCGAKGTIMFVDTSGFHKGKPPITDERLIFEIQFSDSLFGANYPKIDIKSPLSENLAIAFIDRPSAFQLFNESH